MKPIPGVLICIGGPSASGKTTAGLRLFGLCEGRAVLIDPEIARNEVLGRPPFHPVADADLTPEITARTISHMLGKTETALADGFVVIVPSSFVLKSMRDAFEELAKDLRAPFFGFWLDGADEACLAQRRIERRMRHDNGVRDLTTISQVAHEEPARNPGEIHWTIIDATKSKNDVLNALVERLSEEYAVAFRHDDTFANPNEPGNALG